MNYLGLGLAILAAVLWGLTYCLDERVLSSLSVFKLYFLHCVCGAVLCGVIMLFRGNSLAALFTIDRTRSSLPLVALTMVTATAAALSFLGACHPAESSRRSDPGGALPAVRH